jgi:hypothetical protein
VAQVGSLYTSLTLESSSFLVGLKKAADATQSSVSSIEKNMNRVVGAAKGLASALALDAIVGVAKRALDYASSLGEVAQQLGVTSRDLQVYRYAATQVGIEQEEMDKSLAKLSRTIGEAAAGNKAQATSFREIGVSITDANGKLLTAGEVIPRIADALAKVKDPASRARIEVELFGKAGQKLDTLLAGGSGQITQLRNAAEDLGIVLSDQAIQNADRTADKLSELKMVLEANIANAVANNAGAIYTLTDSLIKLAAAVPNALNRFQQFRQQAALYLADQIDNDPLLGKLPESVRGTGGVRRNAAITLGQLKYDAIPAFLKSGSFGGVRFGHAPAAPSLGRLPSVGGGGGGRSRARGGGGGGKTEADTFMTDLQRGFDDAIGDMRKTLSVNLQDAVDDAAREFEKTFGIDGKGDQAAIVKEIDARHDAVLAAAEVQAEKNEELFQRRAEQERTLAGLYTDLMRGGTKAFLRDFKEIGLSIIAQMLAQLTMGNSFGGSLSSALGSVLPGFGSLFGGGGFDVGANNAATQSALSSISIPHFATGGSFRVGGVPGVDKNLISFAASRGEMVDIRRPGQGSGREIVVHVAPSKMFDVTVTDLADGRIAAHAPAIAGAGAQLAINQLNRPRLGA